MSGEQTNTAATRQPRAARPELRTLARTYWPLALLGLLAVVVSAAVYHWVFPAYSWNRDETVYVWQARALRHGVLLPTDGGAPEYFWPWLSGHGQGFFFSQYTLGWPSILAGGLLIAGTTAVAIPFGALLSVLGVYAIARTTTRDHIVSLLAASLMVVSPVFLVQSGLYLGYLFTLGLGLLGLSALLTGVRDHIRWRLVAGGALIGWVFMTRPFDAVLWALAAFVGVLALHWKQWGKILRAALWAALGFAPLFVATLAYNKHVTGSLTQFPITAADPLDTFGFGLKRLMPTFGKDNYTPWVAVKSVAKNGIAIPWFVAGSYLGIIAAGWALWLRRRDRSIVVLVALFLAFPLGYFAFWGMHVSAVTAHLSGPIYFIPLFPPLLVLMAVAIREVWRRRRAFGIALAAVLVLVTVPFAASRLDVNHTISETQVPWKDSAAKVPDNSLVFVEQSGAYLLLLNPYSSNTADLDGPVLYATDLGAGDLDLIATRPGRTPYLQRTSVPPSGADPTPDRPTPAVELVPIEVLQTGAAEVHTRITNTTGDKVVVASLILGDHVEHRTLTTEGERGDVYDVTWVVAAPGVGPADASTIDAPALDVIVAAGFGPTEAAARKPDVRGLVPTRNDGSSLRMMLPVRVSRFGQIDDHPGWITVLHAPDFRVTVKASPSS
ncbi:MAG: hypothetical protein U0W40_20150 [Acidimicrobiia bacterium]